MALRLSTLVIILSSLKLSRGALVLPRPPSSPNDINQSSSSSSNKLSFDPKLYNVKTRSQNSRTNVEKPNTDNYKLLEIELRDGGRGGGSGPNAINFGEILREVFREEELPIKKEASNSNSNKLQNFNEKMSNSNPPFGDNDKLYYLKQGRKISADINRKKTSWEPRSYLKSVGAYDRGDKSSYATSYYRPKKYMSGKNLRITDLNGGYDDANYRQSISRDIHKEDDRNRMILGGNNYNDLVVTYSNNDPTVEVYTTENSLPTSSELPKQIPPPPSRVPNQQIFSHTTPVLKFMSRRTDILPNGYTF